MAANSPNTANDPNQPQSVVPFIPDPISRIREALTATQDEALEIQNIIDNPAELFQFPVPEDSQIGFIERLAVSLSNVGGDSKLFAGVMNEKRAIAEEQRRAQGQNMLLAARQKQEQSSQLMDALGAKSDNLLKQAELEATMAEANNPVDGSFKNPSQAQEYLESGVASGQINDAVSAYNNSSVVRAAVEAGNYESPEAAIIALNNMIAKREAKDDRSQGATGLVSPARWVSQFGADFEDSLKKITPGGTIDGDGNIVPFEQGVFDREIEDVALMLSNLDPESANFQVYAESLYRRFGEAAVAGQTFIDEATKAAAAAQAAEELKQKTEEFRRSFVGSPGFSGGAFKEAVFGAEGVRGQGDRLIDFAPSVSSAIDAVGQALDSFWQSSVAAPGESDLSPFARPPVIFEDVPAPGGN